MIAFWVGALPDATPIPDGGFVGLLALATALEFSPGAFAWSLDTPAAGLLHRPEGVLLGLGFDFRGDVWALGLALGPSSAAVAKAELLVFFHCLGSALL